MPDKVKPTIRRKRQPKPPARGFPWSSKWLIGGGVIGAIVLVVYLSFALSGPEAKGRLAPVPVPSSPGTGGAVSSSLPNFSLALYQGQEILGSQQPRFHDLLGKQPLVLNFWASNCPPCSAEMPEFEKVWRKYKGQVLFFGLDVGRFAGYGGPEDSRRTLRSLGITYPAAPAPDISAVQGLQVQALPSTYFITADGVVYKSWVGTLNREKLTDLIEELLKAAPTSPAPAPATASGPVTYSIEGQTHVPVGQAVTYRTTPPTSGDHWPRWAPCGLYSEALPDELVVHNLEHGQVVVHHNLSDPAQSDQLREVLYGIAGFKDWGVARPYERIPQGTVVLTAWGVMQRLPGVDGSAIKAFFNKYSQGGASTPEVLPCSGG